MSLLPCDVCHETVSGKLYGFYLTVIVAGTRYNRRLKLCDRDLELLIAKYGNKWSDGFILNKFETVAHCSSCGEQSAGSNYLHPMYVTAYSLKGQRYDYYAQYCNKCAETLIDTFELSGQAGHAA